MSKQICFKNECEENLVGFCDCEKERVYFCSDHMNEHFMAESKKRHKFYDIKCINDDYNIEEILKLKSNLSLFKRKAQDECVQIIKQIREESEKVMMKIEKLDMKLNCILAELLIKRNAEDASQNSIIKFNLSNLLGILNYENIESQSQIFEEMQTFQHNDFDNDSNSLCFFQNKTKNLISINLQDLHTTINSLNIEKNIDKCISMCLIPENKIFCYGNFGWWYNGIAFIVYKSKYIQMLPSGKANCFLKPIYFNNNIYAFGGDKNLAEKFNLITRAWETCTPLPKGNFQHSYSVEYHNEIIVAGYSLEKIYGYNIDCNAFFEAPGILLQKETYKMLISNRDKLYIVEASSKIYECNSFDLSSWNCIGINLLPIYSSFISYSVSFKGKEYFINENYELWEFDLKLQTFKIVKKF